MGGNGSVVVTLEVTGRLRVRDGGPKPGLEIGRQLVESWSGYAAVTGSSSTAVPVHENA